MVIPNHQSLDQFQVRRPPTATRAANRFSSAIATQIQRQDGIYLKG